VTRCDPRPWRVDVDGATSTSCRRRRSTASGRYHSSRRVLARRRRGDLLRASMTCSAGPATSSAAARAGSRSRRSPSPGLDRLRSRRARRSRAWRTRSRPATARRPARAGAPAKAQSSALFETAPDEAPRRRARGSSASRGSGPSGRRNTRVDRAREVARDRSGREAAAQLSVGEERAVVRGATSRWIDLEARRQELGHLLLGDRFELGSQALPHEQLELRSQRAQGGGDGLLQLTDRQRGHGRESTTAWAVCTLLLIGAIRRDASGNRGLSSMKRSEFESLFASLTGVSLPRGGAALREPPRAAAHPPASGPCGL
jgi:hypothetical protein